jgi:hypothetical protein
MHAEPNVSEVLTLTSPTVSGAAPRAATFRKAGRDHRYSTWLGACAGWYGRCSFQDGVEGEDPFAKKANPS